MSQRVTITADEWEAAVNAFSSDTLIERTFLEDFDEIPVGDDEDAYRQVYKLAWLHALQVVARWMSTGTGGLYEARAPHGPRRR